MKLFNRNKKKIFVSIIWGYSENFYKFVKEENPYLHVLDVAISQGFDVKIITPVKADFIYSDPNFNSLIEIIDYKNFISYLWQIVKFSFFGAIFYVNSLEWQSFVVPFFCRKSIFMAHTQPKRQTKLKQFIQKFVFRFFTAIRLNNEDEKKFLLQNGIRRKKLSITPLVVSQKIFKFTNNKKRRDLVCFGNITKKKNILTVLRAFEEIKKNKKDIKLNLIGSLLDDNVVDFINQSKFSSDIIIHGFMAMNEELSNKLNENLIYLNSSFDEGQCVAAYDAALCGCVLCLPKIISFTGVFKDCALFHDSLDYKKLAENIVKYLDNEDLVCRHRLTSIEMIEKNYSKDKIENNIISLINEVL